MPVLISSPSGAVAKKRDLISPTGNAIGKTISITSPITLSSTVNVTIPEGTSLEIKQGGSITIPTGRTLTINGEFKSVLSYTLICEGTSNVAFGDSKTPEVYVTWFGADGIYDNGDDSEAFMLAINSLPFYGGTVRVPAGRFNLNILPTKPNVHLIGEGMKRTFLYNNTSVPGTYCIEWVVDTSQIGTTLPNALFIEGLYIVGSTGVGSFADNYHGLKIENCLKGRIADLMFNHCGHGIMPSWSYFVTFENIWMMNYGKGLVTNDRAVNNCIFNNFNFWEGNTSFTGIPIYDNAGTNGGMFGECTFNNFTMEGSGYQTFSTLNGGGNTYINFRYESCTPTTDECYLKLGGVNNIMINPLFTCGVETEVLTSGYFVKIDGDNNQILGLTTGGVAKRIFYLEETSKDCKVEINTTNTVWQTVDSPLWLDYGTNNLIEIDHKDFMFNQEMTRSDIPVTNYFTESTDFSDIVASGLTPALVVAAEGTQGPLRDGNIYSFTGVTSDRKWTQDLMLANYFAVPSEGAICFSFWARSITAGGETILMTAGRTNEKEISIFIPDDKYVRVHCNFQTDGNAYVNYFVGVKLPASSDGINMYGPQVVILGSRINTGKLDGSGNPIIVLPSMYVGGYVPTVNTSVERMCPNHALDRRNKIAPASGQFYPGQHITNIKSAVGQPKGWYCTGLYSSGTPAAFTSEGNL